VNLKTVRQERDTCKNASDVSKTLRAMMMMGMMVMVN
jgi:hypothetical protein